ncbi:hydrogenase subunit MbhD domain-containing protein [Nesterenkonia sp. K-15-9-6]|uniref:hydrogenase subunit MbhD domain-containing protein n=1 Tax=Nesterenkonia sp. K-15-9-6 TaxID=3093918 RepID=UPI004044E6D0
MTVVDLALGLAVVVTAGAALLPRRRMTMVMGFLVMAVIMALVWLRLGSVDVALAETALGTGLLSAILVLLARGGPAPQGPEEPPRDDGAAGRWLPRLARAGAPVLAWAVVTGVFMKVWLEVERLLPAWEETLPAAMGPTGVEHEVTAVLLTFRSYDTLLESAVLMLAGVAVLAVTGTELGGRTASPGTTMSWWTRVSAPALVVVGLWLLFAGSFESGGAFQAGAVLAGLMMLADASGARSLPDLRRAMPWGLAAGVLVFLAAAALGPMTGRGWLDWEPSWGFPVILTVEIALTVGIAAALHLLYLGVRARREVVA